MIEKKPKLFTLRPLLQVSKVDPSLVEDSIKYTIRQFSLESTIYLQKNFNDKRSKDLNLIDQKSSSVDLSLLFQINSKLD